ncbi:hypothetical protein RJ45_04075 [Photobacterium gaetbulicola]|uniref:Uncharacterized protein n=1 Tax=Photobacterium gaetbulicola TaxID=1295392 RepID=A0A0B9G8H1_9GAMM|nr:hypothetical protein RJ45_04075 [Photobacterium gaetbulicola]
MFPPYNQAPWQLNYVPISALYMAVCPNSPPKLSVEIVIFYYHNGQTRIAILEVEMDKSK